MRSLRITAASATAFGLPAATRPYTVSNDGSELILMVIGLPVNGDNRITGTTMLAIPPSDFYLPDCRPEQPAHTCSVQRATSVTKPDSEVFPDGTYLGITSPGTSFAAPTITWTNVYHGYGPSPLSFWGEYDWRDCPAGAPNTLFSSTDPSDELTGIDASQGQPETSCAIVTGSGPNNP